MEAWEGRRESRIGSLLLGLPGDDDLMYAGHVGTGCTGQIVQGPAVLIPEFEALRALASRVINQHLNDNDLCAVCGSAFPCELAELAEHNLDLL